MAFGFSKRWLLLGLGLAILFAALGVAWGVRRAGLSSLTAELAREGLGTTPAGTAPSAHGVDASRQARAWALLEEAGRIFREGNGDRALLQYAGRRGREAERSLPEPVRLARERLRGPAEAMASLLAEGPVVLTSLGAPPRSPGPTSSTSTTEAAAGRLRLPDLRGVRLLTSWWAWEAWLDDDPRPALDTLDRLHGALSTIGCLVDEMIALSAEDHRDHVYLELTLAGRLPPDRLERWLDEPADAAPRLADALRGERLRYFVPIARHLLAGDSLVSAVNAVAGEPVKVEGLGGWWEWRIRPSVFGASDCEKLLRAAWAMERVLRGGITPDEATRDLALADDLAGTPLELTVLQAGSLLASPLAAETEQRAARAAALLVAACREHGALPSGPGEARSWLGARATLLDGGSFGLRLRYERTEESAFRLQADPATPLPPLFQEAVREWGPRPLPPHPQEHVHLSPDGVAVDLPPPAR